MIVVQVVIGVVWYKEIVTVNQSLGYAIALVGFAGYNMAKMGYFDNSNPQFAQLKLWLGIREREKAGVEEDKRLLSRV